VVRATLVLGVAASVAANVLHAEPNPISEAIAAWPPMALLLTVELISRVPVHRRSLAAVRLLATTAIAGIAAWVSYWHMAGVASRYGESGASPYLLPLSVDGLVIVASVSLVELAGRIRLTERATAAPPASASIVEPSTAQPPAAARATAPQADRRARPGVSFPGAGNDGDPVGRPAGRDVPGGSAEARPKRSQRRRTTPSRDAPPPGGVPPRTRRPVAETAALAARMAADQPDLTHDELAARLGITTQRLRRIKREVPVPAAIAA
jgi:hypothetical protein